MSIAISPVPFPRSVEGLRAALYPRLVPIANRRHEPMGIDIRFPAEHAAFIAEARRPAIGLAGNPHVTENPPLTAAAEH